MFYHHRHHNRGRSLLTILLVTGAAMGFFLVQPVFEGQEPAATGREKASHALAESGEQPSQIEVKPSPEPVQPQKPVPQTPEVEPQPDPVTPAPAAPAAPQQDTNAGMWVDVDLSEQQVAVKLGDQTVKSMITSSGAQGADTPQGVFEVQNRGDWFFSPKYQEGAKWWVSFKGWGKYLFHSVVMDENRQVIQKEAAKLGSPASHGCLRLAEKDAKWIYQNVPQGTKVVIHR